jgi:phosphate transport system protein
MQQDVDQIKAAVGEMSALVERALRDAVHAVLHGDRRLALSVILRDRLVDRMEQELDRLCLEFLVRQQPAAGLLRMAYASIRISLELERMGDYAESIARQALRAGQAAVEAPRERYQEMADLTLGMLRDAVKAFVTEDASLANRTIETEDAVDDLKGALARELLSQSRDKDWSFEALNPWMQVSRRLERASDQARNICHEVIYMCTGQPTRHQSDTTVRILFVDETHGSLSQMAQAIGEGLGRPGVVFASAGTKPQRLDTATVEFMQGKGADLSRSPARAIYDVPGLDQYQVVVALGEGMKKAFPRDARGRVFLEWKHPSPAATTGPPEAVAAAYEAAYRQLEGYVVDLLGMLDGESRPTAP